MMNRKRSVRIFKQNGETDSSADSKEQSPVMTRFEFRPPRLSVAGSVVVVVVVIVMCLVVALAGQFVHRIDPGYAAVKVDYGQGTAEGKPAITSLGTGQFVFYNGATQRIAEYPISQQSLTMVEANNEGQVQGDDSVQCRDSSGVLVRLDSTTLWRVDPSHVGDLYLLHPNMPLAGHEGSDISSLVVRREARNAITLGCSQYTYIEINGPKRQELGDTISKILEPNLQQTYVVVDKFLLGEVHLEQQQQDAINAVAQAQQQALQASYLKQKAQNEADAAVAKAEGDKKVAILQAEGQAQAIQTIDEQLGQSNYYVQYLYATKWDGRMPSVVGSGVNTLLPASLGLGASPTVTDTGTQK